MRMVSGKEISVVVQGAVAGKPGDPPAKRFTDRCLRSVRRFLPDAEIILSTSHPQTPEVRLKVAFVVQP